MRNLMLLAVVLCLSAAAAATGALSNAPGALVKMDMDSTVGVLLDEIPEDVRAEAVRALFAEPADFWIDRAAQQIWLTDYRLDYRGSYYPTAVPAKGALPLPPSQVRHFALTGPVHRTHIGTHDYVAVNYHFSTYMITDAASPGASEPALAAIGGTWDEPFLLPADPILVFQRTGYACMDEQAIPAGSVFGEAVRYFYDQACGIETPATSVCHVTQFPNITCADALPLYVGLVTPNMHFTRVTYDPEAAAQHRVGSVIDDNSLLAISKEQLQEHAVVYRYIPPGTCGVGSGPAPTPGWRRLLIFSSGVYNQGSQPVDFGDQTLATDPYVTNHVLTPEPECDGYDHFTGYGNYSFAGALGAKQAYCIGDGDRYLNVENASLTTNYETCTHQGIDTGWGDAYQWGLPNQWVDITELPEIVSGNLTFALNPDKLICEGQTLGSNYKPVDPTDMAALVFDPTNIQNANGQEVGRVRCNRSPNADQTNTSSVPFATASGSYVNLACHNGELGPRRDCGFEVQQNLYTCTAGSTVNLKCHTNGSQQVLRVCESSEALGAGVSCTYPDSVYNDIVDGDEKSLSFTCPLVRDSLTRRGGYSVYRAPLLPWMASDDLVCTGR